MGRHERVLHDVLGGELVAQQEPGEADEAVPVGAVELDDGDVGVRPQPLRPPSFRFGFLKGHGQRPPRPRGH